MSLAVFARCFHLERSGIFIRRDLRCRLFPDNLARQSAFRDIAFVVAQIEEFFAIVASNIDPMSTSVEFFAERSDKLAGMVEHNNRVLRIDRHRAVFHIDQPGGIDGNAVRILPANVFRHLHAIVMHLVLMAFRTNHGEF